MFRVRPDLKSAVPTAAQNSASPRRRSAAERPLSGLRARRGVFDELEANLRAIG